ncbi:MAG: hypothetical protein K1X67_20960 [Fimbriimonadaceae bacterium]|nr:hypothetical protein [Fimbriimonadaceae bacterium]
MQEILRLAVMFNLALLCSIQAQSAENAKQPAAAGQLLFVPDIYTAAKLYRVVANGTEKEVAEVRELLAPLPHGVQVETKADLAQLVRGLRVRLRPEPVNFVGSINLRKLVIVLESGPSLERLQAFEPMLRDMLGLTPPDVNDRETVQRVIRQLKEFDRLFLDPLDCGFDPAVGPTEEDALVHLRHQVGLPLAGKLSLETVKVSREGRETLEWVISGAALDLGFGVPAKLPPFPIGDANLGMFYRNRPQPVAEWLELVRHKAKPLRLPGGTELTIARLELVNQGIVATLSASLPPLPGTTERTELTFDHLVRFPSNGSFDWSLSPRQLRVPIGRGLPTDLIPNLGPKLSYDPQTGELTVAGRLTADDSQKLEESVREAAKRRVVAPLYATAVQLLKSDSLRLTLGGFVRAGLISREEIQRLLNGTKEKPGLVGFEALIVGDGSRSKALQDTLAKLSERIDRDPRGWIAERLEQSVPKDTAKVGTKLRVVLTVGGKRVELPGWCSDTGELGWNDLSSGLVELTRNEEVLAEYLRRGLRLPGDLIGNAIPVRVSELNYDPDEEELSCRAIWASPFFERPLEFPIRIPTTPGKPFDWKGPLRAALTGKELHLGPALRVKLGEVEPGRWPASVTLGDLKLSLVIGEKEGKLALIEFDRKATAAWLKNKLPKDLLDDSVRVGPVSAMFDVEVTEKSIRVGLVLGIDLPTVGKFEAAIDNSGVRVRNLEEVVIRLVARRVESLVPAGFSVTTTPRQAIGDVRLLDAVVSKDSKPFLAFDGLRVVAGKPTEVERVRILAAEAVSDLKLSGPGWSARATRLGFEFPGGLSADVELRIESLGELLLQNIVLGKGGLTAGALSGKAATALLARVPQLKPFEIGPFTVGFGMPASLPKGVRIPVTLSSPSLGMRIVFPEATFELERGLIPGKADAALPDTKALTEPLQRMLAGAVSGLRGPLRVTAVRWELDRLDAVALVFDAEVDIPGVGWKPTKNHRIDRTGFRVGDVGDLSKAAEAMVADAALKELAAWKRERTDLGPLTFKNIKLDEPARKATADAELLGRPSGSVRVEFPNGAVPRITWDKPEALLEPLRAWADGWVFRIVQDRVRFGEPTLVGDGFRVQVGVKLPELDLPDFIDLGFLSIGRDGVRFEGDGRSAEAALWKKLAKAIDGHMLTLAGFPLSVKVERAVGEPTGLHAALRLKVEGLGEAVAPLAVSRSGITVDRDRLIADLVLRIEEKLQKETAGCRVQLTKLEYKTDVIHLSLSAQIGLKSPVSLDIRIDRRGVHGLDLGLVVTNALNQLVAELKGQKVTVIDGIELEVTTAEVVRNPDGVRFGGKGKFGPIAIGVENVFFDGKKFNTSNVVVKPEAADLMNAISIDGVATVKSIDASQLFTKSKSISVTVQITLIEVLEALLTVRIGEKGVSIDLPIGFSTGKGFQVPVPPVFMLTNFKAELAREYIGGGCDITLLEQTLSALIKMDCRIRIPIKGEPVFTATGRLVVMSVLPAGNVEARADFAKKRFDLTTRLGVPRVLEVDGKFFLDFAKVELEGSGDLKAFSATLAHAKVWFSTEKFGAEAELSLLLSQAKAKIDGKWKPLSDTTLTAEIGFGFYLFGKKVTVAGAQVEASLRPSAKLSVIIIGVDITLLEVDLAGITIEKIIDLLLRQPISLAGFKLLASQGGGGVAHIHVHKGGAMHLTVQDAKTCAITKEMILSEKSDGTAVLIEVGHGRGEKSVVVLDPAKNQKTEIQKLKPSDDLAKGVPPYAERKTAPLAGTPKPGAKVAEPERIPAVPPWLILSK